MLAEFFFAFLRIGMKSWSIKAQKRMSLISSHLDRTSLIYKGCIAFDEGECMLIVSFLRKSLSRVLWTSPKGFDHDFRHKAPFWIGGLAG